MAISWFQKPEARTILNALTPQDIYIKCVPAYGLDHLFVPAHFEWVVRDETIDRRLDLFVERATEADVGYKFKDAIDQADIDRWLNTYDALPSVQAFLNSKFGDPNVYWGRSEEQANAMFTADPGYPMRVLENKA